MIFTSVAFSAVSEHLTLYDRAKVISDVFM